MSMDQLLNMPEEQVEDGIGDLNDHLISLYSTTREDESDDEGVQVLPKVQPQQVLNQGLATPPKMILLGQSCRPHRAVSTDPCYLN
jgi:hypothetical protein